jgi:hypothetical protein
MKNHPKIGDTRTFTKYKGVWKIIDFIENKQIKLELVLKPIKCPHCGGRFGDRRAFIFNRIETLECDGEIKHLGITDCNRYILFQEYFSKERIEEIVKEQVINNVE